MKIKLNNILIGIFFIFLIPVSVGFQNPTTYNNSPSSINKEYNTVHLSNISFELNQAHALSTNICDGLDPSTYGDCLLDGILSFFEFIWFDLTQVFLILVGLIMDAVIGFSISSSFYHQSGIIEAGWEILRDLTNILFIFALLITAFKLVLGQNDGNTKKTLVKTILIALVVNFSLFMSYAIIDGSNILAHVFYNRIEADSSNYVANIGDGEIQEGEESSAGLADVVGMFEGMGIDNSVSLAVAGTINPQRIITNGGVTNFFQALIIVVGMGLMNILLIYIFFSVTLTFLGRILGLIILTILSPIRLVSIAIPKMKGIKYVGWDNWFPEILKLSFVAPIFLFFLWLAVTFATNEGVLATLSKANPSANLFLKIINTYLLLFLIGGFLYLAKKITQSMAGELGNLASKTIQGAIGGTIAAGAVIATGGAAAAGLATRGVGALAGDDRLKKAGKNIMSFKADVTKIPGFNRLAGESATKAISKVTGRTSRGAEVKARAGMNALRTGLDNILTGKTPKAAQEYQDLLNKSRDDLLGSRIENTQREASSKAKIPAGKINLYDEKTNKYVSNTESLNTEEFLKQKQAELARMEAEDKKAEADRIRKDTEQLRADLEFNKQRMKDKGTKPDDRKKFQAEVNRLTKEIEDVENTSTEGIIKQIEKQLDNAKNDARAKLLQKDVETRFTQQDSNITVPEASRKERVDTQAARVTTGEVKSTPKVSGKAEKE